EYSEERHGASASCAHVWRWWNSACRCSRNDALCPAERGSACGSRCGGGRSSSRRGTCTREWGAGGARRRAGWPPFQCRRELVGPAYNERFRTSFTSSSVQGRAKLNRRKYGESIENTAATNEYHWMAGNYLKSAGRWDTLPVDSHELVAMVAPRPVFLSTGNGPDLNPDGSVKMMQPGDSRFQAARGPVE